MLARTTQLSALAALYGSRAVAGVLIHHKGAPEPAQHWHLKRLRSEGDGVPDFIDPIIGVAFCLFGQAKVYLLPVPSTILAASVDPTILATRSASHRENDTCTLTSSGWTVPPRKGYSHISA